MKIKVMSREGYENCQIDEDYVLISITDPGSKPVKINIDDLKNHRLLHMIRLEFHDVDKPLVKRSECTKCKGTGYLPQFLNINDGHCYQCTDKLDIKLFDDYDARNILDGARLAEMCNLIVVHCEAGISRSAGVAGALSLIMNGTDEYYFKKYLPNMFVYRKILNAYMRNK